MTGQVLILGAGGRFGRSAAEAFWNAGWQVRVHNRETGDLMEDARGADVIVNGWNAGYSNWARALPGQTRSIIAAARASGATVLQPGNLYVYGTEAPERLTAQTPHGATNPLGRLRIEMAETYRASGVQVLMLRAGDYLDPEPSGNWFDGVLAAKARKGRFTWPGNPDVPHSFAWLPDVARAAVALSEKREALGQYEEVLFPGYTVTGRALADASGAALGRPLALKGFFWPAIWAARAVWPMARGLYEMRYLWSKPHAVDRAGFDAVLPGFAETPLHEALPLALRFQIDPDQPMARGRGVALAE